MKIQGPDACPATIARYNLDVHVEATRLLVAETDVLAISPIC